MLLGPREGARPVDKSKAQSIADSIRDIGLLHPIIVAPAKKFRNGADVDGYDILAGQHRFWAMNAILGWDDIPCKIHLPEELHAELRKELVTIDENLMRAELLPAEEATVIGRRKAIYEQLHPETRHGANQHTRGVDKLSTPSERFTAATAEATGKDERTIRRAAARGTNREAHV